MKWETLARVRMSTRLEFTPALSALHTFVRLPDGMWTRVLGMPGKDTRHLHGRCYAMDARPADSEVTS